MEIVVSFCLFFVAFLLLQSLIFQKGYFGNALVIFLKNYVGYFGAWIIDIFFFVFSWLIYTKHNIDLLLKQAAHKCLVVFDFVKYLLTNALHHIKIFIANLKAIIKPRLQNLLAKKQQVIDLQVATREQTMQAQYDFKNDIVEETFDEMQGDNTRATSPEQDVKTQLQHLESSDDTSNTETENNNVQHPQKSRLEIVENTESVEIEEFFKSQLAAHKDMLQNLKTQQHTALFEPILQDTKSAQSSEATQDAKVDTTKPSIREIPIPPPRPINPSAFMQTTNEQQNDTQEIRIKDENLKASQSAKSDTFDIESMQRVKEQVVSQVSQPIQDREMPIYTKKPDTQPSLFTDILPLSHPQNEETKQNKSTPVAKHNLTKPSITKPPILPSLTNLLELDIQEIQKPKDEQWADSIVQEIPQKPQKSTIAYSKVSELDENKNLLNSIEYGKIDKPTNFKLPLISFLSKPMDEQVDIDESEIDRKSEDLLAKLKMFRIEGDIMRTYSGPIVTTFEFRPAPHIKVSKILTLEDDLAMALRASSIRIQAPIPGKDVVGIEIPNNTTHTIYLREILESDLFKTSTSPLTLALGKDIIGNPFITDLKKAPHLLIAGTTGSGKSVGLNAMVLSLLYKNTPDNLKLLMIDPKKVEFSIYTDIPHLIAPIISQPKKAITALNSAVSEMEKRLDLMSKAFVRDIDNYNRKMLDEGGDKLPYLVIIIDELSDLMMTGGKEVEYALARIAQMGRASGIHIIVATQRPSVDVITGLIKANLPSRISYKVGSKIDSKVILDIFGAESLLGRGDMLFKLADNRVIRLHAPWSTEEEIEKIATFVKSQQYAEYDKSFMLDEKDELITQSERENSDSGDLITEAKNIILQDRKTSASYLQRRLSIGYNKAANIIEQLERDGFLSAPNSKGVREIIGQ